MIERFNKLLVTGPGWSGNAGDGYMFRPAPCEESQAEGSLGAAPPPPPPPMTGACCVGEDCSIETEADCEDMGGTYQGDDTECDPNPCASPPCCPGYFTDPVSGNTFLTKIITASGTASFSPPPGCFIPATAEWSSVKTITINPDTCEETCECSGSVSCDGDPGPGPCTQCSDTGTPSCTGVGGCDSFTNSILDVSTECTWNLGIGCTVCCASFGDGSPTAGGDNTLTWDIVMSDDQFVHATQTTTYDDPCVVE